MSYELPRTVNVGGVDYDIRSDYRVAIDIHAALNDPDLEPDVRAYEVLQCFYPDADHIPLDLHQEAVDKCLVFLQGGQPQNNSPKEPKLIDWEQDFPLIVSPVNRVLGTEIRAIEYLHWWSFLSAYYEIGDCLFTQIVSIRDKLRKRKPLDKSDQDFYRRNRALVDLKTPYTEQERAVLKQWTSG